MTVIAMIPIIVSSHLLSKIIMNPSTSLTRTMKEITFKTLEINNKKEKNKLATLDKESPICFFLIPIVYCVFF